MSSLLAHSGSHSAERDHPPSDAASPFSTALSELRVTFQVDKEADGALLALPALCSPHLLWCSEASPPKFSPLSLTILLPSS